MNALFRRRIRSLLVVSVLGAPFIGAHVPTTVALEASRAPRFDLVHPLNASRSANWAGYQQGLVERQSMFSQVAATWTVPPAIQHAAGTAEASALWVGIGGGCPDPSCTVPAIDPTLIQAGTAHEVAADGTPSYYAWWEVLPLPSVRTDLDVQPGDVVRVDIRGANGDWVITVVNETTGGIAGTGIVYPAAMTTAEWILEAPTVAGNVGPAPMPALPGVRFGGAEANGRPANLDLIEAVSMADTAGHTLATPSAPNAARDGFSICQWSEYC